MDFVNQWRQQINGSLVEAAKLVSLAPDVDLKYELMVIGVLWPARQPIHDFNFEAMSAVQEIVGEGAKSVFQMVQQWEEDRLKAARNLSAQSVSNELDAALKLLIGHFNAFPVFAKQLAAQLKAASLPPKKEKPQPTTPQKTPRVFIAYHIDDGRNLSAKARNTLQAKGVSVWKDLIPQQGQRDWLQQVTQAIERVDFLVLIMTPAAVESRLMRRLWRMAHQGGTCIYPVTEADNIDFSLLPRWIRQVHFYNLQLEWPKLIHSLNGKCRTPRIPFMADDLPDDFVNRPKEMDTLVSYLFDPQREEALANAVALYGAGGYGKSTLARAVCHNDNIRQVFDNGILWVTLGETPGDLSRHVIDLIEVLSGERPGFTSLEAAVVRLEELLADREILLVIDDVWNNAHLKPFLQGGNRCARLITTRNINTVPRDVKIVEIDAMQSDEAVTLLRNQLPDGQQKEMQQLATRMGGWPLLLKLTNGTLRDRVHSGGQNLPKAIRFVNRALDQHGLSAFDQRNAAARNQAVSHTIQVSLELLDQNQQSRYTELAIFPEDINIPLDVIERLWAATGNLDDFDTEELCNQLHSMSLLSALDLTSRRTRLHKVMRSYLMYQQPAQLPEIHNKFIKACHKSVDAWARLPSSETYLWTHLAFHLLGAGRWAELVNTVKDIAYLAVKSVEKGAYYAESDIKRAETAAPNDKSLKILRRNLSQASHLLVRAKSGNEAFNVLHSRMAHAPIIGSLVDRATANRTAPLLTAGHILPDLPNPLLIRTLWGHSTGVMACAVSDNASTLVSVDKDNTITVWQTDTGKAKFTVRNDVASIWACDINADGRVVVFASNDGSITLLDTHTEKELRTWQAHKAAVISCAINADASVVVSASKDKTLKVWNTTTGAKYLTLAGHERTVTNCDINAGGNLVVSASNDGTLKVWNGKDGREEYTFIVKAVTGGIDKLTFFSQRDVNFSCAMSADGSTVAAASTSGRLSVWDVGTGAERFNLIADQRGVYSCALNSHGTRVVAAVSNGVIKTWDAIAGTELLNLAEHPRNVNSCSISGDGALIVSASDDKTLKLWDGHSLMDQPMPTERKQPAHSCDISADGSVAISAMADKTLKVWDVSAGAERATLRGHTHKINYCALSLDGSLVVTASQDQTAVVWDTNTGKKQTTLAGHTWAVSGCALDAAKTTVISASDDSTLKVWDINSGAEKQTLNGHKRAVNGCALSANGYVAVSASGDSTLKVWNPHTGEEKATLNGHAAWVNRCAVSSNGNMVVSASFDKTLKIWDTRTATEQLTLKGHTASVTGCALSANGAFVVSASRDKSVKVWQTGTGNCLATLFLDEPLLDIACSADAGTIIAVSNSGVYFLKLVQ